MQFKLTRQKISEKLNALVSKKIEQCDLDVPLAPKKILKEIAVISRKIKKNGLPEYLVLKKLQGKLGYGIFLHPQAKAIAKGTVIGPYSGKVLICPQNEVSSSDYVFSLIPDMHLTKEEQRMWDPKNRYHPRRLYSVDLDAEKMGNFTRFINHSEKPNIEAYFVRMPSRSKGLLPTFEIIYIAKKKIRPGEQLLVCYEGEDKSYWGALNIKPFPMTPQTFRLNVHLEIVYSEPALLQKSND